MTIVHINTESMWGGGEVQTCYLIRGLEARGVKNVLVAPPGSEIAREVRATGTGVAELRMRGECDAAAVVRLSRILRDIKPAVLHLHTSHAHTLGWLAGRLAKVEPIIVTRRMDHEIRGHFSFVKYSSVDHIVAISEVIRSTLIRSGLSPEKLSVIHSAVDCRLPHSGPNLRSAFGFRSDIPVIGTVATLAKPKGHQQLFEAMRIVRQRHPSVRLLVAGTGPQESRLRQLAVELNLAEEIVFAGFRKDIPQILSALDVFVLASQDEGLGVALLEAACCGLPLVATNVGGIPEVVRDGSTGFLVAPGDTPSLAERIMYLLEHRQEAREMGQRARAFVRENFSLDTMVQRYHELYGRLSGNVKGS
jgi:glycosyltransferase involved in cell wall biosynthesis